VVYVVSPLISFAFGFLPQENNNAIGTNNAHAALNNVKYKYRLLKMSIDSNLLIID
jgi:hypothetical protein